MPDSAYFKSQRSESGIDFGSVACEAPPEVHAPSANKNSPCEDRAGERNIVEVARKFMHDNFSNKICVDQIAKKAFVSQYHFSRIFKRHTHYSPYQYLLNLRLEYARMLMEKTQLSIKEITFRAGFSSLDYFSSAFTKRYKSCPSIYRKTLS